MNTFQSRLEQIEAKNKGNEFKHTIQKITREKYKIIDSKPFHFKTPYQQILSFFSVIALI